MDTLKTPKLLSLEFFSKRFFLPVELLSYGLMKRENEDTVPVILVKGKDFYINFLNDRFSLKYLPRIEPAVFEECIMVTKKDDYIFKNANDGVILGRKDMEKFYDFKCYSVRTPEYLGE